MRESISLTGQFAAVDEILTGRENLTLIARLRRVTDAGQLADGLLARFQLTDAATRRVATYFCEKSNSEVQVLSDKRNAMPMGNAAVRAPDRLTGEQLHARGIDQTARRDQHRLRWQATPTVPGTARSARTGPGAHSSDNNTATGSRCCGWAVASMLDSICQVWAPGQLRLPPQAVR